MYSLKKTTLTIHFILLTCIAFCNCWDVDFLNENKNVVNLFHNSLIKKFKKEFKFKSYVTNDILSIEGYKKKDKDFKVKYTAHISNDTCDGYKIEWNTKNDSTFSKNILLEHSCWNRLNDSTYYSIEETNIKIAEVTLIPDYTAYNYKYFDGNLKELIEKYTIK